MLRTLLAAVLLAPNIGFAATPAEIAERAAVSVKRSPKWERIEVQRATPADYALIVWYRQMPADHAEVERDTKAVARSVLKQLAALKALPASSTLHLVVRARMPEKGETGKQLVRVFGSSRYNSDSDHLAFERNK